MQVVRKSSTLVFQSLCSLAVALAFIVPSSRALRAEETILDSYCLGNAWESCFIYFDGTIRKGLADQFEELLQTEGPSVYLNSPGGDLQEALTIGRLIRKAGRVTKIGSLEGVERFENGNPIEFPENGVCESACAYAFMGGEERDLDTGKLGLHRFYSTERGLTSDEAQFLSGVLVEYMVEMGVDARLFLAASREGAAGMYYVSESEALDYSIITARGYDDLFLEPYLNGVVAASRRLDPPKPYDSVKQVTFFCERGRPHVMLTANSGFLEDVAPLEPPTVSVSGGAFQNVAMDLLEVRDIGDLSLLTIEIPNGISSKMFNSKGNVLVFSLRVLYSRASGGAYSVNIELSDMDVAMVTSAFRHCIR